MKGDDNMLHADNMRVKELLLKGKFGLEKENLRITKDGYLAHSKHPFPEDKNIVRDFSENQIEINTPVFETAKNAVESLAQYNKKIQRKLYSLNEREYLWPFSNPPYIVNEDDIPIAQFYGDETKKTEYREYLSDRYGRYKMCFCGIHFNYSFAEELLEADFEISKEMDYIEYKNKFYVSLAQKAAAYGWIMVAVTAASPIMDSSFVEKKKYDVDNFNGMASVRCSELGYWNFFAPVFDYSNVEKYADSIEQYVKDGWIKYPSELYYPIRLKPKGDNSLENLRKTGVNHIELRMFDLNPLTPQGIEQKDIEFAQLFLVWLATLETHEFTSREQIQSAQNFKNAAHYDLKTVKIVVSDGEVYSVSDAALKLIREMKEFYKDFPKRVQDVLVFEEEKFVDQQNRYAWKVKELYGSGFVKKGIELAKIRQETAV